MDYAREKDLRVLLPFCVEGVRLLILFRGVGSGWLCSCRPAMQGMTECAINVLRYKRKMGMRLTSRDTGSSAGRTFAQIGT